MFVLLVHLNIFNISTSAPRQDLNTIKAAYGNNCALFGFFFFAPVDPWAKRWPTDLAIPSSSPAQAEIFSNVSFIAQVL